MNNEITRYILSLLHIKGIGPIFIKKRLEIFREYSENPEGFKKQFYKSLSKKEKEKINVEEYIFKADEILAECSQYHIEIISIASLLYPNNLLELKDPPPILYCKGNISLLEKKIVAIIGTRKASKLGEKIANKVGAYFSRNHAVCNGLVDGVDKFAILDDDNVFQNVIGVLSGGLNFIFTSSKITQELAMKTLSNNGLLISEYEPNKKEDAFSGSKASRIQAGLADALVLIQSSINGGSKYTLNAYKDLDRVLGVINFDSNNEFLISDKFEANRIIVKYKKKGLVYLCSDQKAFDIKKLESMNESGITLQIVNIENYNDYAIIADKLSKSKSKNNSILNYTPVSESPLFQIY